MTTNGFETRLSRLEARRNPPPDPRVAAEAYGRAMKAILGLAATIEPREGEPPVDIVELITGIIEERRRG